MSANPYEPTTTTVAPSVASPIADVDQPARRFTRLAAAIVDGLLMMAIVVPIQFATGHMQRAIAQQASPLEQALMSVLGVVTMLALNGYLLVNRGQTIGKMLTGIQIVDLDSGGIIPFLRVYVYRYLWSFPLFLGATLIGGPNGAAAANLLVFVNVLFIFGAARRCLHDRFAGSKVVLYREGRPRVA